MKEKYLVSIKDDYGDYYLLEITNEQMAVLKWLEDKDLCENTFYFSEMHIETIHNG